MHSRVQQFVIDRSIGDNSIVLLGIPQTSVKTLGLVLHVEATLCAGLLLVHAVCQIEAETIETLGLKANRVVGARCVFRRRSEVRV
ncbi:hypothetical protein SDC9_131500 [bioreactor metagenome]|uniref:Uncharacterized protein n=1 Tax=bioreactor metagenome TaxID=1076179 RepID=A0A645D5S5_9ZZZZ